MKRLKRIVLDVIDDGFSYSINRDGPLMWMVLSMFCLDLMFFDLRTNKSTSVKLDIKWPIIYRDKKGRTIKP